MVHKKNPQVDEDTLYDEMVLIAVNDGDAYRSNKNAVMAVDNAIRDLRKNIATEVSEDTKSLRARAIAEVRSQWTQKNPAKSMVIPNPSGEAVAVIRVQGSQAAPLNMVISDTGGVIDVLGKDYARKYPNVGMEIPIKLPQSEYQNILKAWGRVDGRENNPAFELNEPVRASIGAAIGGGLGALGGPWTAVVIAALGSLVGSNWKKITASTSAYRQTARANNPEAPMTASALVGRLKF